MLEMGLSGFMSGAGKQSAASRSRSSALPRLYAPKNRTFCERSAALTSPCRRSHACVTRMRLETKFLHLKTPVTLGSRFGDWRVCWLGGWTRHRLSYLVMVVRV